MDEFHIDNSRRNVLELECVSAPVSEGKEGTQRLEMHAEDSGADISTGEDQGRVGVM